MRAAILLCIALGVPAAAAAEEANGRVRGLYVEAARGVLVDAGLRKGAVPRWADVELEDARRVLVQVPPGMRPALGDEVSLRLGEPKSTQLAQVLPATTANRALALMPAAPQLAGNRSAGDSAVK